MNMPDPQAIYPRLRKTHAAPGRWACSPALFLALLVADSTPAPPLDEMLAACK